MNCNNANKKSNTNFCGMDITGKSIDETDRNRMSDTTLVLYVKKLLVPIIFRHGNVESTGIIEISMILPVSMMV